MNATAAEVQSAIPPPAGVTHNFINPPNSLTPTIVLHTIFLALTTLFLCVRLYTRHFLTHALKLDDYMCVLSWVFSVVFSALFITDQHYGLGTHMWNIPATNIITTPLLKYLFAAEMVYLPTVMLIKITFFLFFYRVFGTTKKMNYLIHFGIFSVTVFYVAIFFRSVFLCDPVARSWNPTLPGHCLKLEITPFTTAIFNILSDIYVLVLPIPTILNLNMQTHRKIRLLAVFSMGVFVCIASIVRLAITVQTINALDTTWEFYRLSIWAVLEVDVGLMCSCSLAFPAFFDHVLPNTFGFSHYFKLSTYFSGFSRGQPEDDTKKLHSNHAAGYRDFDRGRAIPEGRDTVYAGNPYYGTEMNVRRGK